MIALDFANNAKKAPDYGQSDAFGNNSGARLAITAATIYNGW